MKSIFSTKMKETSSDINVSTVEVYIQSHVFQYVKKCSDHWIFLTQLLPDPTPIQALHAIPYSNHYIQCAVRSN